MKRLLRIFDLSKKEQRAVLIVILLLLAIAFIGYERRVHLPPAETTSAPELKRSPSPVEVQDDP